MARKASVIMSAAERKTASADLTTDIKAQKHQLGLVNDQIKADQKELKEEIKRREGAIKNLVKERDAISKGLTGLTTRKAALTPPKPIHTQA